MILKKSIVLGGITLLFGGMLWLSGCSSEVNPSFTKFSQHPFPDGEHARYFQQADVNWDVKSCYACHTDPDRSFISKPAGSCSSTDCHGGSAAGVYACNTCHGMTNGDADNPFHWAPPKGLRGEEATDLLAVGAHQAHLNAPSGKFKAVQCSNCHVIPESWDDDGHILNDDTPGRADVIFSGTAIRFWADSPQYDPQSGTCSSTHCHGSASPAWNEMLDLQCTSCHGMPPVGRFGTHPQDSRAQNCYWCHGSVVDADRNIIDKERHINGYLDF